MGAAVRDERRLWLMFGLGTACGVWLSWPIVLCMAMAAGPPKPADPPIVVHRDIKPENMIQVRPAADYMREFERQRAHDLGLRCLPGDNTTMLGWCTNRCASWCADTKCPSMDYVKNEAQR